MDGDGARYAVVQFVDAGRQEVRRVVAPFPSAVAADLFALENGYAEYAVTCVSASFAPPRPRPGDLVGVSAGSLVRSA